MPKLALAASVPAIDWNSRSTGAPASRQASWVVMWARQQAWVGNLEDVDQPVEAVQDRADDRRPIGGRVDADHRVAAAEEQAIGGREQDAAPGRRPGWLGWTRMPSTRARPSCCGSG